jgi:cytochrome c peroxidase
MKFHDVAIPAFGPGIDGGVDEGRAEVTGADDRFRFRTASLRNVALTPPYMHDGIFYSLDRVLRHYIDARASLESITPANLDPRLQGTLHNDRATLDAIIANRDTVIANGLPLNPVREDLVAFLQALTDPAAVSREGDVPAQVPSGIPVGD